MSEWNVLRNQPLVLAVLLFAWWAPAVVAQTSAPRVTLNGTVDPLVAAGSDQSINATFEITLPDGYHVNSDAPLDEFLKPTRLLIDAPDGVAVAAIRYPEALLFATKFSEQPLAVYEHEFRIEVALTVTDLAPGEYPLQATLKYQACSDRICYPPATRQTEVTLTIQEG